MTEPGDAESMWGIPAKKSRDRLDNGLLIDVPGITLRKMGSVPRHPAPLGTLGTSARFTQCLFVCLRGMVVVYRDQVRHERPSVFCESQAKSRKPSCLSAHRRFPIENR